MYLYKYKVLAEHLLFQESESTPNTSFADSNTSDTDSALLNDENTPLHDKATLSEDTFDSLLIQYQV